MNLALRDPAAAAAFGIMPGADMGADFGNDWAGDVGFGDDMGLVGFGDDAGFGAAATAAASVPRPTEQQAMALWKRHHMQAAHTARREALIDPNKHSTVKIEKYVFPLNQVLTFGTAVAISMSSQPDTKIRPQRVTTNAPVPMMILLTEIKVANVSVTIGAGNGEDAFAFNANGQGQELSLPTLEPSNKATVLGTYGGLTPPGFLLGGTATFVVSFKGPSTMAG
jgi:hypothetical protein